MWERLSLPRMLLRNAAPLFAALGLSGCRSWDVTVSEDLQRAFQTPAAPHVIVQTSNGNITATTSPGNQARITVTKYSSGRDDVEAAKNLKIVEVTMDQEGDAIHVGIKRTDNAPWSNWGANVHLDVPVGSQLTFRSSNGNLSSRQVGGKQSLRTSNGNITVTDGTGEVDMETKNGSITVTALNAAIRARTSNGRIVFDGTFAKGNHCLETRNGSISITLPPDATFHVDASTRNGSVRSDFPLSKVEEKDSRTLIGSVGENAEVSIKAATSNDSIRILRRLVEQP